MIICIAGLTGSGKTRLGDELSRELSIEHVGHSYKSSASNDSQLIKMLEEVTPDYIREFDRKIVASAKGKDCVVTTWHGPWIIKDATLRVWLNVAEDERVRRIAAQKGVSLAYARKYTREKDERSLAQYRRAYGKDMDDSVFDLKLNYDKMSISEAVAVVSMLAREREAAREDKKTGETNVAARRKDVH